MIAVNEIDIRETWRTEQDSIALRLSDRRMRRWIFSPEISFDLHNSPRQQFAPFAPDQNFAQQTRSYQARITIVKRSGKNPKRSCLHLFRKGAHDLIIAANADRRKCGPARRQRLIRRCMP